jgi:predicted outer membrane repeat protein
MSRLFALSKRIHLFVLIAAILAGYAPLSTQAGPAAPRQVALVSAIVVDTTALTDDDQDGKCDLYEALSASFLQKSSGNGAYHECTDGSGQTLITFSAAIAGQTITLPVQGSNPELPMINDDVAIVGPITIDGGGKDADLHIFRLAPDGVLSLTNLTLTNGYTSGSGGAILDLNDGTINLLGVSFIGNSAESNGGAIDSNGTVNILGSAFTGNRALGVTGADDHPGVGFGGAIYVSGYNNLNVAGSAFTGNIADKGGGAIYFSGESADIADSTFNGNLVLDTIATSDPEYLKGGGAIYNDSDAVMHITRIPFDGNLSLDGDGGALYNNIDGVLEVADSSFNANLAGDLSDAEMGGAIYNTGILTVTRSALLINVATGDGGAVANDRRGRATLANTTLSGNAAAGAGGGLWNGTTQTGGPASILTGTHLTLSDNTALDAGAIYNQEDGEHTVSLGNSIVNQGLSPMVNCNAALASLGHNVDSGNSCGLNVGGDQSNTDPQLQGLMFNGGPLASLLSQKLQNGSPAIDAGAADLCAADPVNNLDQRSESRPKDGSGDGSAGCDAGAIENAALKPGYGSSPVQPGPLDLGSAAFGNPTNGSFSVFETGNHTLTISGASLSGPDAAQFAVVTAVPFDIADGDPPVDFELSCTPVGPTEGGRNATLTLNTNDPDHPSVVYDLSCHGSAAPVAGFGSDPIPPGPMDFGAVEWGNIQALALNVFETGNDTLNLSNPVIGGANPGDFLVATPFPLVIPDGGGSLLVGLECNPQDYGVRTATLTFDTNDPSNASVSYNLVCKAVAPPPPYLDAPGQSVAGGGIPALNNPYGVAISPDGQHVYAAGETSDSVSVFERDLTAGTLSWIQALGDPDSELDGARIVLVSPDGTNVYVASYLADTLVVYTRDPATGFLTKLDAVNDGDGYGCFPIPCDGFLDGLDGAYGMALSPDGRFFYASGVNDDGLVVLRRNSDGSLSGLLSGANFVQSYINSTDLNGAYGIALSPDGAYLYATGYLSDSLLVFRRDAIDGTLTFVEKLDAASIPGLNGVFRVTVSPDGVHVYTASWDSDSLTVFQRNPVDGRLTHLATYTDGVSGVDGLDAATSVALSPDSQHVFATAYNDDAVTVFERDAATGLLTFVEAVKRDSGSGLPALNGARDVAVSPDGRTVIAAGHLDSRVVALQTANPIPLLESLLPASAQAGGAGFTLAVQGQSFVPGAVIRWDGTEVATTFVSPTELQTDVTAAAIASAGTASVDVLNPEPGSGASPNSLEFVITAPSENPVPSVDYVKPQGAMAGDPGFTLSVFGTNFMSGSTVQWNGADRVTTFIGPTELRATIPTADIAQPGSAGVRVVNPAPGGGASNTVLFDIAAPGQNPVPTVTGLTPNSSVARGAASAEVALVVQGSNFVEGAQVQWNGDGRPTLFVSPTELRATLRAADVAVAGSGGVRVVNPEPGGGPSNTATFTILPYALYLPLIVR